MTGSFDWTKAISRRGTGAGKWWQLEAEYPDATDLYPFSVADNDMDVLPEIRAALVEYSRTQVFGYSGIPDSFYAALADWLRTRHQWTIESDWVLISTGVVTALFNSILALTTPDEAVIVMEPVYPPFMGAVERTGRRLLNCPLLREGLDYKIDFDLFERQAADPATRLLLLCSPHNPVGRVWIRDELERMDAICRQHDVIVLSDEIHADLILPGYEHVTWGRLGEAAARNAVICVAPSKTFNIAGFHTAAVIIPDPELRRRYTDWTSSIGTAGANRYGLVAAETAWRHGAGWLDEFLLLIAANHALVKDWFASHMPDVVVFPLEGTYLQWLDFAPALDRLGLDPDGLDAWLREKAAFYMSDGRSFGSGGSGCMRLNIGCPEHILLAALERLGRAARNA
ncbi:MAG: PatB family C-S lyase [Bacillota bacterium]|nr:PatB family C-S lyase [Bacillota bacterium]